MEEGSWGNWNNFLLEKTEKAGRVNVDFYRRENNTLLGNLEKKKKKETVETEYRGSQIIKDIAEGSNKNEVIINKQNSWEKFTGRNV